jgi:hypothetical protein
MIRSKNGTAQMPKLLVRYDFAGSLLFPSEPQQNVDLGGIVTLSGPVSGFFEFDANSIPASPGQLRAWHVR